MLVLWLPPCIHDRLHNAKPGECIWEPSLNKGFVIVVATIGHHGSCFVMLFCYCKVFLFMRKHRAIMASHDGARIQNSDMSVIDSYQDNHSEQHDASNTSVFVVSELSQGTSPSQDALPSQKKIPKGSIRNGLLDVPTMERPSNPYAGNVPKRVPGKQTRHRRDRAIFITLSYVLIGYAICWMPFHVVFDISSVCPSCVPRDVYGVTFWMTYINSTINPVLYNFSTPEFRRTFKRLLFRK